MGRITGTGVRLTVAAIAATGLAATGMTGAQAAARATGSGTAPQLRVAITDTDMYLDGSSSFAAGRLKISLENKRSKGKEAAVEVARLAPGYTWHDWRQDIQTFGQNLFGPHGNKKKGLKALNHAIAHITTYGG